MTPPAHGIGAFLDEASGRLLPVLAVSLAIGLLTAIFTDGAVPVLVTKILLAAMVLPTVGLAFGLTRASEA